MTREITREEIMNADVDELSRLAAIHIMGECAHEWVRSGPNVWNYRCPKCGMMDSNFANSGMRVVGHDIGYARDISAAFEILEKPEIMDRYQVGVYPTSFGSWVARKFMPGGKDCTVQADTAPKAIVKCVLLATMEETP